MSDTGTRVERIKYRGKETAALILSADNMSVRYAADGTVIAELFRYGSDNRAIEGYQFHFAGDDAERLRVALNRAHQARRAREQSEAAK